MKEEQNIFKNRINCMYRKDRPKITKHQLCDSTSTDSSLQRTHIQDQRPEDRRGKEKLELCKKFIDYGYCPYMNKCKFAHGSHELRKDNRKNSLYKTKQCIAFQKNGFCHYGKRCNFLHKRQQTLLEIDRRKIRSQFIDFLNDLRSESRLMAILE